MTITVWHDCGLDMIAAVTSIHVINEKWFRSDQCESFPLIHCQVFLMKKFSHDHD